MSADRNGDTTDSVRRAFGAGKPKPRLADRGALSRVEDALFGSGQPALELDRYLVEDRIGRGGMGVVYRAFDPELERHVALKLVHTGAKGDTGADGRTRLLREAQAMARVSHPNVIAVHDVGTYDLGEDTDADAPQHGVYIVMELVDGVDLRHWLTSTQRTWKEVLDVFLDAGRGLAAAHAAGLVHRDFKPANVLVASDGRIRVLDFGLALVEHRPELSSGKSESEPTPDARLTQDGTVLGTPRYMAPEQHRGDQTNERSDQYSFCVALYEALYRGLPFEGHSLEELVQAKRVGAVRSPPEGVPASVHKVVLRGLRPEPDARFESMDALLRALEHVRTRRRRWTIRAAVGAGVLAAAGFGVIVGESRAPVPELHEQAAPAQSPVEEPRDRIALLPFDDQAGDPRLDFANDGLPHLLAMELKRIEGTKVVTHYRVLEHAGDGASREEWVKQAVELGAGTIVRGSLAPRADRILVRVLVEKTTGEELAVLEREVSVESVPETVRSLAEAVASAALGQAVESSTATPRGFELERRLQLGIRALERDQLEDANEHLRAAAQLNPASGEVHYYLALLGVWSAQTRAESLATIDRALDGGLDEAQRAFLDAYRLHIEHRFAEAVELFRTGAAAYPEDRYILYGLFEALYHGGRPHEAMEAFRRMREVSPRFNLGVFHVLDFYAAHGDEAGLTWALDEVRRVDWKSLEEYEIRALIARRDYRGAIERLVRLEGDQGKRSAYWIPDLLTVAYARAGQLPLALAVAEQRVEADGRASALLPMLALHTLRQDQARRQRFRKRSLAALAGAPTSYSTTKMWVNLVLMEIPIATAEELQRAASGLEASVEPEWADGQTVEMIRTLVAGTLADKAGLERGRASNFPAVRSAAQAFVAELGGDFPGASAAWSKAIHETAPARFLTIEHYFLARVSRTAGDREAMKRACERVLQPFSPSWSWVSATGPCKTWLAE